MWNGYTVCSCFPLFQEKCSCHMQNWVFLCCLDNLLQKNVIVFFFGNQISKWRSFEKKRAFVTYFSHFLVTRESYKHSYCTYLTHIHTCILLTLLTFFLPNEFKKKKKTNKTKKNPEFIRYGFSLVRVLVLVLIRASLEQSINNKMVSKI